MVTMGISRATDFYAVQQPCSNAFPAEWEEPDRFGVRRWCIDVPDLAALLDLVGGDGIIIQPTVKNGTPPTEFDITIYDGYIE